MQPKRIILIGGAPLTGKTTLAKQLSKEKLIPWISTDDIRAWMKEMLDEHNYPALFYGHNISIEKFYETFSTPQSVFENELKQCICVQKGLKAFIKNISEWNEYVIEGHALTPEFINELRHEFREITFDYRILFIDNPEEIKKRLDMRGLWDDAEKYPDKYKPIEFEWTLLFDEYLKAKTTKLKNTTQPVS